MKTASIPISAPEAKAPSIPVKKILLTILAVVIALALAAGIAVFALWHNEIFTLMSFTQLRERDDDHQDGSVYYMEVSGGFYLDEFVEQGGVSSDSELIAFITDHITKGLIDMGISESDIACSSFTATSEEGHALFARNYDFSKTNTCIVKTKAVNGRHASLSTIDLQFLSIDVDSDVEGLMDKITCLAAPYVPLDGVNDAGVSVGIYMTYQGEETVATDQKTEKPDLTSTTLLRLILDYADSVEDAVEIAQSYDLHDSANTSYHYMVADSTGRSAVLEWVGDSDATDNDGSARTLVVTYSDKDNSIGEAEGASDYQWVTNFILQPGYYESDDDKAGLDRYEAIYEALSATDGVVADSDAAMDILALVGRRSWNSDGKGCTVHSVVYDLTEKSMLWVSNENYDDPTAVFTFRLGD
jgi:hypothetical protein